MNRLYCTLLIFALVVKLFLKPKFPSSQIVLKTKIYLFFSAENIGLLLSHGADLEVTNGSGRKPIHVANDEESLRLLLEHGANANAVDQVYRAVLFKDIVTRPLCLVESQT